MTAEMSEAIDQALEAGLAFEKAVGKLLNETKTPAHLRESTRAGCHAMLAMSFKQDTSELPPAVRSVLGRIRMLM